MCLILWCCDACDATFDQADELGTHHRLAHHPLTPAIEYLAGSITARVLAGGGEPDLYSSRRVLLGLIGERAYDVGLSPT